MTAQYIVQSQLSASRLATIVASRFVLNAVFRLAYPLIPFVTAYYRVSDTVAPWIVTSAVLSGLASPLGGWLGERFGYRRTMLTGLILTCLGMVLAALAPIFWLLVAAYAVCGIGIAVYQPAMQAYVSALTPYHERGRAIGLVELSWALAGMAAIPPLVLIVEAQGNATSAFMILAFGLGLATFGTYMLLPNEARPARSNDSNHLLRNILLNRNVIGLLVFIFLGFAGVELFYIVQPVWASARFNVSLADLGTAALVFGAGELVGSSLSAWLTDRLGKLRAATVGFSLSAGLFVALPLLSQSWISYLVCYFVLAICVEFAIVASLTLASTVHVVGRAAVMALTITVLQLSRAGSSQIGVPVLQQSSMFVTGVLAGVVTIAGVVVALCVVREAEREVVYESV
jgi:predicted MFS family arabinose efflux permease